MNMQSRNAWRWLAASVAIVAGLSACGGDDNSPPPATSQVPASASQTTGGFIAYLQALVASAADTLEPVDTGGVTPPTDDTIEPQGVD